MVNYRVLAARLNWCVAFTLWCALVPFTGCVPPETVGSSSSGYQRFTTAEMKDIRSDELRNLQFFTSGLLRFSTGEQAVDDSIATEEGRLMKIQTRQYRSVEIPTRTPGVLVEMGQDWIDLDVGDGVVLRFRETGTEGEYQCVAFNGQAIQIDQNEADSQSVEYDGEKYELATNRPVYLEYFVRHVVNVDRANQRVGGKRIDEPRTEPEKKAVARY